MDMVARQGPNGTGGGATFITGSTLNAVTRSRYGKRLPQNTTREVKQARNLVNATGWLSTIVASEKLMS
jgi:structural maintenance of chromosomes protein 5